MSPLAWIFSLPVKGYRDALDALKEHGGLIGGFYAARRILRCNPWGGCGYDPVPPKKDPSNT